MSEQGGKASLGRRVLSVLSTRWRDPSTCEACGGEFMCGATLAGCWCTEVKLTDAIRADLRSRYRSCLCRDCLEKAASGSLTAR